MTSPSTFASGQRAFRFNRTVNEASHPTPLSRTHTSNRSEMHGSLQLYIIICHDSMRTSDGTRLSRAIRTIHRWTKGSFGPSLTSLRCVFFSFAIRQGSFSFEEIKFEGTGTWTLLEIIASPISSFFFIFYTRYNDTNDNNINRREIKEKEIEDTRARAAHRIFQSCQRPLWRKARLSVASNPRA